MGRQLLFVKNKNANKKRSEFTYVQWAGFSSVPKYSGLIFLYFVILLFNRRHFINWFDRDIQTFKRNCTAFPV